MLPDIDAILDAADPIRDHALVTFVRAYRDTKRQLDEVANAITAIRAASTQIDRDQFMLPDGAMACYVLAGEKLRHQLAQTLGVRLPENA